MIGTVTIPLSELIKGASIHDRFPIRKLLPGSRQASDSVGTLEAKISIIDLEVGGNFNSIGVEGKGISGAA